MSDIFAVIQSELEKLGLPQEQLSAISQAPDTTPLSSLRMDSLDFLSVLMTLEEKFDVQLEASALPKNAVVSDLVKRVESLRSQKT